jgi:hypothetical protein
MFVQNPLRKVPGRIREDNIYEYVGRLMHEEGKLLRDCLMAAFGADGSGKFDITFNYNIHMRGKYFFRPGAKLGLP